MEDLASRAAALVSAGERAVLGITGAPGSGKTTSAKYLMEELRARGVSAAYVPMDGFHLADIELERLGSQGYKGAPQTFDGWGYLALLTRACSERGHVVYAPSFDRELEQPVAGAIPLLPEAQLIITEGNYLLLDSEPWSLLPLKECWFVEVSEEVRLSRLLARHVQFGKSMADAQAWVNRVDEPNARLVAATRDRADLVITRSGV